MYIIQAFTAIGRVHLRKSERLIDRFTTKSYATKFADIGEAKEWLACQECTMNKQVWESAKIIEVV